MFTTERGLFNCVRQGNVELTLPAKPSFLYREEQRLQTSNLGVLVTMQAHHRNDMVVLHWRLLPLLQQSSSLATLALLPGCHLVLSSVNIASDASGKETPKMLYLETR